MKFKIKFPKLKKRTKLRATAVRRPLRAATAAEYEELAEPNMKLSRALLIVLILHVVAVSGIIAFNAIKTRERPVTSFDAATPAPRSTAKLDESASPMEVRRAHATAKPADETHKAYTVGKGDSPVSIAKKLKVPYDDLIALNHIDDPHKLKIGQKLLIPNKAPKAKKAE